MSKYLLLIFAIFLGACSQVQNNRSGTAEDIKPLRAEKLESTVTHTSENQPVPGPTATPEQQGQKGKWTQSGNPIDTAKFDGVIAEAEKAVKARPNDESARKTLSEAYFDRGFALTEARQYASALGDYRRALKYDPNNEEAKKWLDQIISIYDMLKKEYPKEGEEPPPLPFKKS